MENEMKILNLKLPSNPIVNMGSCWETLKVISKTGKVFLDTDLVKNGAPVNEKNLFRILAYLKYLGFLYEKREREEMNGNPNVVQRWFEEERQEIADFFFYLRDNREAEAKEIFTQIIKEHDLYLAVKTELLKSRPSATKIELKDFLRRKLPGKSPNYYGNGVKVILEILQFCNLIKMEGNFFSLNGHTHQEEKKTEEKEEEKNNSDEDEKKDLGKNKYIVSIYGADRSYKFPVNNSEDLLDVEAIIGIIKRKLL